MFNEFIKKIVYGIDLSSEEAEKAMEEIMNGNATQSQIGAFLTALKMKGETINEIVGFAKVMRRLCHKINPKVNGRLIDTCGTGGDVIKTFNISTTAAFIIAGAGVPVAKHGNRSVTSKSGSADVLEQLGLRLDLTPKEVEKIIENEGIGFMFAPVFHEAMKNAAQARKEIGIRTVFNILGPLTNPAGANAQLLGVYDETLVKPLAYVLKNLGCKEAIVTYGLDGLDEIYTIGKTLIAWLKNGEINLTSLSPRKLGVKKAKIEDITGLDPKGNAEITFKILNGVYPTNNPKVEITLVNAAAGLILGGRADNFSYGLELAKESIESGRAYEKLKRLIKASGGNLTKLEELESRYA
ncbi:MAG: anthranilate phosphoribosyltransferase [Candidatus Bathyarchaeia archaeon]